MASASDDFTRADSTGLGANWSSLTGFAQLQIVSNVGRGTSTSGINFERYTGLTWANEQWAQVKLPVISTGSNDGAGPAVRMTAGGSVYYVVCNSGSGFQIRKYVNGVFSGTIGTYGVSTPAVNDTIRLHVLEVSGVTTLRVFRNTFITPLFESTDTSSPLLSGNPGAFTEHATLANAQFDDWSAEDVGGGGSTGASFPRWRSVRR